MYKKIHDNIKKRLGGIFIKYQNIELPNGAKKIGETPMMTENTILPELLRKHMAPKGKYGYIVVEKGKLEFVWEDNLNEIYTADKKHPIVIEPERYHHLTTTGNVEFKVEFYNVDEDKIRITEEAAVRPGEDFINKQK